MKSKSGPSNKRHSHRDRCAYCGARIIASMMPPRKGEVFHRKTWDHVLPYSVGGVLTIPCCALCNSKKADLPVSVFLASDWLSDRRVFVLGGWGATVMPWLDETIIRALEKEDLHAAKERLRAQLERLENWK
jgi:hypothetical protein